jgi:hypothetical protein
MPRVSNRSLGGKRTEIYPKPGEGENPEPDQNNETPDRRSQPIPIPDATLTIRDGQGRTGIFIAALLEESFRLQLAKDEAKKLSRRRNKSEKKTR